MTRAVRGAIVVAANERSAIESAGERLVRELLRANRVAENDIVSLVFSMTRDLDAANPATGLRRAGFAAVPLFCVQEAHIEGAMPRVLRVLLAWNGRRRGPPVPLYLDGAEALRPDLSTGGGA